LIGVTGIPKFASTLLQRMNMKRLVGVELSHQKAPLAIREKISLTAEDVTGALLAFKKTMPEVFIISTCNRLSVYALTDDIQPIFDFFREFGPLDPYLSVFDHDNIAIRHLFATACGLESQAVGEHEILGQIKKAYALAQEVKSIGAVMDELIRRAISVGKKVRQETAIGQYPVSLASVSCDILRDPRYDFTKTSVLVLGTGEMANLVLKISAKKPYKNLFIASRSYHRAETMEHIYKGSKAISMEDIHTVLPEVDVIIGATHTNVYALHKKDFENIDRNVVLIDLGLPRNFDPEIKTLKNARLYDLDDMKAKTDIGLQKRQEEIPKVMGIIEDEILEFNYWINTRQVSPLISSYYEKLDVIREEELKWALPKLGKLDENQQKIIENLISRVTRRVSGKPIEKLRHFSQEPHIEKNPIDTFKELFDL
jgi:glutamyl-tRNA reductase